MNGVMRRSEGRMKRAVKLHWMCPVSSDSDKEGSSEQAQQTTAASTPPPSYQCCCFFGPCYSYCA